MNAVIYARYSSHGQRETSIEGQLKECYAYAAANNLTVIREYIDRARTGTNDSRPEFQKMLQASARQQFEVVLVYQLDRFSRNRYDSANNKARLKKNGVKVVSVRENITDDASGVLIEAVLEGMAEYYSAELSQKVKRGISVSAEKCRYIGGFVPLGYAVNEDKTYAIDQQTAPIVQKCFELYAGGHTLKEIDGIITAQVGKKLWGNPYNALNRILTNRNYIGIYTRCGLDTKDGMPRIVADNLFERVQERMGKNKKAPARARAYEEYLLTTKLFCGYDREMMVGVSGTSKTKRTYNYYTCKIVLHKGGCQKKNVRKEAIEDFVIAKAREQLTDENIAIIAQAVSELSKQQNSTPELTDLKKQLKECETAINNLLLAIEHGEHIDLLSERISKKREEKTEIEKALAYEQEHTVELDDTEIRFFLNALKEGNADDMKYRRALIAVFVNAIYLYDDHANIIFNANDRPVTIDYPLLDKLEADLAAVEGGSSSYMNDTAPPLKR